MTTNTPQTPQTPNFLQKIGISAKDIILIVFIVANSYLVMSGHQQLDTRMVQLDKAVSQTTPRCQSALSLLP